MARARAKSRHCATRTSAATFRPPNSNRSWTSGTRPRSAYERRNRDLDPQLAWRSKNEHDWFDLIIQAPPLYIQEKVHPKVLIADFNGLPEVMNVFSNAVNPMAAITAIRS